MKPPRRLFATATIVALALSLAAPVAESADGLQVTIKEFPSTVYVMHTTAVQTPGFPPMVMHCAGILIAPNKVLTAAHCVYLEVDGPADLDVVAGRGDRKSDAGKRVHVTSTWSPPKYDGNDHKHHDIAVLTLAANLPYKPIKIAGADQKSLYALGAKATVLGWGHTKAGGTQETNQEPSTVRYLHKAAVQVVKDGLCETAYNKYDTQYRKDIMLCASRKADGNGQGACPYDDGGPLIAGSYVIGVVSFGNYCELTGPPVAYTRVEAYASDINKQIN